MNKLNLFKNIRKFKMNFASDLYKIIKVNICDKSQQKVPYVDF